MPASVSDRQPIHQLIMATSLPSVYTQEQWAQRLVNTQPAQWFSDTAKNPGGVLYSICMAFGQVFTGLQQGLLLGYDASYIQTAVGTYLDTVAQDFFGTEVVRAPGEPDASFAARIMAGLLQPAATWGAMNSALTAFSGASPTIIEPWDCSETGNYDRSFFDVPDNAEGGLRLTPNTPYEVLVIASTPSGDVLNGNPVTTYDDGMFFDSYTAMYADIPSTSLSISLLYDTIRRVAPVGVAVWVQLGFLTNAPEVA